MLILGLTGGIACGKTTIANELRDLGAAIVDGDALSRVLTAPGGAALPGIRKLFGDSVFHADGTLNRAALGAIVFADEKAMADYDALIHPMLFRLIDNAIEEAQANHAPVCVLDMPLLYEVELDQRCDRVWCAYIPEEIQIARLWERDGLEREAALQRIRSQMPTAEKAKRADLVIHTDRPIEETAAIVREAWVNDLKQEGGASD